MPVGLGMDVHRLVEGRPLLLGGVEIPHPKGLLGHSDGDVVLHAIIDALLGAAGEGDIGTKFPDTDPALKGAASDGLLTTVVKELESSWTVVNVDLTIMAEEPKIAPHREAIRKRLLALLPTDRVSVKATTAEGLGPIGNREAIACLAVVELQPR